MAYFSQGANTRLTTDASPVGLGAILEQQQEDGLYRPIYYASRKLNNVERRYSQFEREALGVRWACQKFYLYLYGINFEICTDHKPLITVLGPKSKPPSARIERWLLYLQQFKYKITHIPGRNNAADVLSRLPVDQAQEDNVKQTEEYAYSIASDSMPAALVPRQVEEASRQDPILQSVREAVKTGDWNQLHGTPYKALREELWVLGYLVIRGNRIVMPESLWNQTIKLAHEGHQGMVRTKARLREKVWWPQMDKQVETTIRSCHPCQLVGPRGKPEPIRSTILPEGPWTDLAIDLVEIPGGNHLLVVVDYYSRWPEVVLLKKTDAGHVTKSMEAMFRTHGLPDIVRSDNGPPFASKEFEGFLDYLGVDHKKGVPYWPQSNGEVERCNETLLKIIRIANLQGKDWKEALNNFLFQYRTTPHTVTVLSPAELLMGRKLRDKIPKLKVPSDRATEVQWQQLLRERDARAKLRQKEYADGRRSAKHSAIEQGDQVLLKQNRQNKLSPNYEPEPYIVTQRNGNAVVIENADGESRMRNIGHMKKSIQPEGSEEEPDQIMPPKQVEDPTSASSSKSDPAVEDPTSASSQQTAACPTSASVPIPSSPAVPRPARARQAPAWMRDYVCVCGSN